MKTSEKKLRLNVEDLEVEAFTAAGGAARRGTVRGHNDFAPTDATCMQTCGGQIQFTCPGPDPGFCQLTYDGTC
jgi:hypothetical protein